MHIRSGKSTHPGQFHGQTGLSRNKVPDTDAQCADTQPSVMRAPLASMEIPPFVQPHSHESHLPSFLLQLGQGQLKGIDIQKVEARLPKGTTLADWPGLQFYPTTNVLSVGYEREFARGVLLGVLESRLKNDDTAWRALAHPAYMASETQLRKVMIRNWQEATGGLPICEFSVPGAEWFKHDATRAEYSGMLRALIARGSFVIGEHHDRKTSMKMLLDNLPELAEAGFRTIYLEGLSIHMQGLVDAVFLRDEAGPLSASQRSCLAVLHPLTRQLLERAAQLGMRVVGLDHHAARNGGVPCKGRIASMNYAAAQVIDSDPAQQRGLFVACVGHFHARRAIDPFDQSSVMGIGQALGVPSVLVTESGGGDPDVFCVGSQRAANQSPMQALRESVHLDDGVRDEFKGDGWDYYVRACSGASLTMTPVADAEPQPHSRPNNDERCSIQ